MPTLLFSWRVWLFAALYLAALGGALAFTMPHIESVTIAAEKFRRDKPPIPLSEPHKVSYPYERPTPEGGYVLDVIFTAPRIAPPYLHLTIDGCWRALKLNFKQIPLDGVPETSHCKNNATLTVDVKDQLKKGKNHLKMHIHDASPVDTIRFDLSPAWWPDMRAEQLPGIAISLLFLVLLLSSPLGGNVPELGLRLLLFAAFALAAQNLLLHDYLFIENDAQGHRKYLKMIYTHLWPPAPNTGWQTYQPPLYYALAIPFYAAGKFLSTVEPVEAVRIFALWCYSVFLLYGLATLRLCVRFKPALYAAALLLIAWPIGTVLSGKINNDVLIYPLVAASVFYLLRWQKENFPRDLWRAIALALLSVAVKSSGLLLCLTIATVIALRAIKHKTSIAELHPSRLRLGLLILLAILCIGSNFGRTLYYRMNGDANQNFLVGNMSETSYLKWPNRIPDDGLGNYLTFNPWTFFADPFFASFDAIKSGAPEATGSDNALFWNSWAKTLIFGGAAWKDAGIAQLLLIPYLALLGYTLLSTGCMLYREKEKRWQLLPMLLMGFLSVCGMIAARLHFPVTGFADARYMYFVLPWLLTFFALSVDWHREHGRRTLAWAGLLIACLFTAGSLFFLYRQWL